MTIQDYYKRELTENGYNLAKMQQELRPDENNSVEGFLKSIYYQDEMDYCIISDYLSSFVGGDTLEDLERELKITEIKFIESLGFELSDFIKNA